MKQLVLGILAHVDAGKTTLSEAMLFRSGSLKKLGRVDHQNAFLDTEALERERGITIFSKQAVFPLGEWEITLLDTPGHVDFSCEMERTLRVLDAAVLVISGSDGVQGHTRTLWKLLTEYRIPTFLFINKMDLAGTDRQRLSDELQTRLDAGCVDLTDPAFWEHAALTEEAALEEYLETGALQPETISRLIAERRVFPCYFGSALRLDGVDALLDGISQYAAKPAYPEEFGARVYKISRDAQGNRLTYLKVTGGSLRVRDMLTNRRAGLPEEQIWEEKVNQIRIYSGAKYQTADQVQAGQVCAVTGLSATFSGEGLGFEQTAAPPLLQPVLTYRLLLPAGSDVFTVLGQLQQLEEEEPQFHIVWNEQLQEIHLQLMGEVQLDVLTRLIADRFGLAVSFDAGNIVYRETIAAPVEGVGHFEPLRHYAEVHLLLEPGERGSGLQFETACSEDVLDRNWQRLILTHLEERSHLGVLTGSPITDMKLTLLTGRAHEKHTEGGDFRQATYRAVRQGLMCAESILLEPWYQFRLELPAESLGRAMADLQRMSGEIAPPELTGAEAVLVGSAPVAKMQGYATEVHAYTGGRGRLFCTLKGYEPCHNQDEVVRAIGYDPERDLLHTPDSVFCAHGAGFVVKWNQVQDYMHLESGLREEKPESAVPSEASPESAGSWQSRHTRGFSEDKELQAIFEQTYGPVHRREFLSRAERRQEDAPVKPSAPPIAGPEYLLVDGYNVIFAWEELKQLAHESLAAARQALMDLLSNYQGFRGCVMILVFDAYQVPQNPGEVSRYHNIYVVYTKEAETADAYIEKTTYEIGKKHRVRVVTSDGAEQLIILGHGALRISARAFHEEVAVAEGEIAQLLRSLREQEKTATIRDAVKLTDKRGQS